MKSVLPMGRAINKMKFVLPKSWSEMDRLKSFLPKVRESDEQIEICSPREVADEQIKICSPKRWKTINAIIDIEK